MSQQRKRTVITILFALMLAGTVLAQQEEKPEIKSWLLCDYAYYNFGEDFMEQYCTRCHHSEARGAINRQGAPDGLDFNKVEVIRENKDKIIAAAYSEPNTMPPDLIQPDSEERSTMKAWLQCEYEWSASDIDAQDAPDTKKVRKPLVIKGLKKNEELDIW